MMTWQELNSVWTLKKEVERQAERLKCLQACVGSIAAPTLDGMPHTKPLDSGVERLTVQISECENQLSQLQAQMATVAAQLAGRLSAELSAASAQF